MSDRLEQGGDLQGVQALLFAAALPPLATQERARRGRGATPQIVRDVVLGTPNPSGRSKLHFRFRPLRGWDAHRLDDALALVVCYFERLGGFRVADDAIVGAFYRALDLYRPEELRWAIAAKAASLAAPTRMERRLKLIFRGRPETFIARAGYWLSQSPMYWASRQEQRHLDELRLRRLLSEVGRVHGAGFDGLSAGGAGRSALASAGRAAEARQTGLWNALTPAQRAVALAAIDPVFAARCEQWGERPDDPKLWPVRLATALSWTDRQWPRAAAARSEFLEFVPNTSRL